MFKLIRNIIIIFVLVLAVIGYQVFVINKASKEDFLRAATNYSVEKGINVSELADQLEQKGIIKSASSFKLYARLNDLAAKLKAGEYQFPQGASTEDIIKILSSGQSGQKEKEILIKEGMNNKAIEDYLKKENLISDGSFLKLATTLTSQLPEEFKQYDFIKEAPTKVDLEGFLFPDTYRLYVDDNGEALIKKMLANFDKKVTPEMRAEVKRQGKSLYQVLVMASIIEKEVRSTDDMKMVSGIFWNRINNGQRLESCATLAYILGVNKPQYSYEDTQIDSPFNTYRNDGLPPTPIGNPGFRAIEAAIYPTKNDYNFFLSDPKTGNTVWARTFEEHKANKAKYLQ